MMTGHLNHVNNALHNVRNAQILIHVLNVVHTIRHYRYAKTVKMVTTRRLDYVSNVKIRVRPVLLNKYVRLVLQDMGLSWILIIYAIHANPHILFRLKTAMSAQVNARNVKEYLQIA